MTKEQKRNMFWSIVITLGTVSAAWRFGTLKKYVFPGA